MVVPPWCLKCFSSPNVRHALCVRFTVIRWRKDRIEFHHFSREKNLCERKFCFRTNTFEILFVIQRIFFTIFTGIFFTSFFDKDSSDCPCQDISCANTMSRYNMQKCQNFLWVWWLVKISKKLHYATLFQPDWNTRHHTTLQKSFSTLHYTTLHENNAADYASRSYKYSISLIPTYIKFYKSWNI